MSFSGRGEAESLALLASSGLDALDGLDIRGKLAKAKGALSLETRDSNVW